MNVHGVLHGIVLGLLGLVGLVWMPASWAQGAPGYTDAGRVLQMEQQNWRWRQMAPWATDPFWTQPDDPMAGKPLIEYHNMDVQGSVVTPTPTNAPSAR